MKVKKLSMLCAIGVLSATIGVSAKFKNPGFDIMNKNKKDIWIVLVNDG